MKIPSRPVHGVWGERRRSKNFDELYDEEPTEIDRKLERRLICSIQRNIKMNDTKQTVTVVLFKLSIFYVLAHLFFGWFADGFDSTTLTVTFFFNFAVYLLLPLIGLFAISDYYKTASRRVDVNCGRAVFRGILALNIFYTVVRFIFGDLSPTDTVYTISRVVWVLYEVNCIVQLVVFLILLKKLEQNYLVMDLRPLPF